MLDIKPYLPFCDALPEARAPPWVRLTCRMLLLSVALDQYQHVSLDYAVTSASLINTVCYNHKPCTLG